ncbi:hypothetical protein AJ80_08975 [Polytolypa hystricis UAMH7299]|uniref:Aminoglycoside phosphotransferase domain-containing protein n=1 Tax=Polytolypa hystricis (strain UAMH7299) TaxID=1447883 RepID=A0A2B7WZ66_POLH7|nr:hypothetical protein AJ80_08975 [Polytolypa hystricis UAMH7299]
MKNQDGAAWKRDLYILAPMRFPLPNPETIKLLARRHLGLGADGLCEIQTYGGGACNELYFLKTHDGYFLMRVSLPVRLLQKTMSEVATIEFARSEISMPVPTIVAYHPSTRNELGFEWMLMGMMPGEPLDKKWTKLPMSAKEELVRQLARYQAKLFEKRFLRIGSLYKSSDYEVAETPTDPAIDPQLSNLQTTQIPLTVGRAASTSFVWDHYNHDVRRGPFKNSYEWLHARLTLSLADQEETMKNWDSEDEEDVEISNIAIKAVLGLLEMLPNIFLPTETIETTIVHHDDLRMSNILVDDAGKITGIVDWEFVCTLPLWRACQLPYALESRDREKGPNREDYPTELTSPTPGNEPPKDSAGDEGVNSLFWEHLVEYELTKLRRVFISEMEQIQPGWVEEWKNGALKAEFEKAVEFLDNDYCFKLVGRWVDAYQSGQPFSLKKGFLEDLKTNW